MNTKPLCVDMDGTLIRTDLLYEGLCALAKHSFFSLFLLPFWLIGGKANMKEQIAKRVQFDPALLPYNEALIDYLRAAKAAGRVLVLATASPRPYAELVANHLGLFDRVLATEHGHNLSARNKADRLCALYGERQFVYVGNSSDDLKVWGKAGTAILVDTSPKVAAKTALLAPIEATFDSEKPGFMDYLKAVRLHQWLKNILIFVPLFVAHRVDEAGLLTDALLAFFAFGMCASSVYLLNDLLDLPSDRLHPRKRMRPFASGMIPILHGVGLIPVLLLIASLISLNLPSYFTMVLACYYLTTFAYSMWLKNQVIVDVITLAALYTFRIIAGAAATKIVPSFWLLAFSMFLFLSLAMVKRYSELLDVLKQNKIKPAGRGYNVDDLSVIMSLGTASGYLSVLVLALYVNSPDVRNLYSNYRLLWLVLPPFLFWISQMWMKTHRGEMHDDPVVFAVRDRSSLVIAVFIGVVVMMAGVLKLPI